MTAADIVTALERDLITDAEACEAAMVDDLDALYRKAVLQLAPHLAGRDADRSPLPC